jgi:hypothetical protein
VFPLYQGLAVPGEPRHSTMFGVYFRAHENLSKSLFISALWLLLQKFRSRLLTGLFLFIRMGVTYELGLHQSEVGSGESRHISFQSLVRGSDS